MPLLTETFILANGVKIPKIGLGTWQVPDEAVVDAVRAALRNGYRHIDSASIYQNESGVGNAVRESAIPRDQIFITTKVPANIKTYKGAVEVFNKSLELLKMEYVDLLLIHGAIPWGERARGSTKDYFEENIAVWTSLEEAFKSGKARVIGVSNFEIADLQNIMAHCEVKPMVNQIKFYIGHTQDQVTEFCQNNGILVEGYSPLATGRLLGNEIIKKIALKYSRTVPQVCIRYVLQRGVLPLPKSTHEEFIIQNADIDFAISQEDMSLLNQQKLSFGWAHPPNPPKN